MQLTPLAQPPYCEHCDPTRHWIAQAVWQKALRHKAQYEALAITSSLQKCNKSNHSSKKFTIKPCWHLAKLPNPSLQTPGLTQAQNMRTFHSKTAVIWRKDGLVIICINWTAHHWWHCIETEARQKQHSQHHVLKTAYLQQPLCWSKNKEQLFKLDLPFLFSHFNPNTWDLVIELGGADECWYDRFLAKAINHSFLTLHRSKLFYEVLAIAYDTVKAMSRSRFGLERWLGNLTINSAHTI